MSFTSKPLVLALVLVLGGCGQAGREPPESRRPPAAIAHEALVGEWYNTETSVYPDPSIAVVKFHPAGGIVMTGLDGSAQYGEYRLADDGRLTIRLAERNRASLTVRDNEAELAAARTQLLDYPVRVIFDAVPVLRDGRFELQTPQKRLVFSRDDQDRAKVDAATLAFKQAHEAALRAEAERQRKLAEQRRQENLRRVRSVLGVRTVLPQFTGAGARACSGAVLRELRRLGWRTTTDRNRADAILAADLSGIQYKYSAWIGRYYKMSYTVKVRRAADGRMLAAFDGNERAAGQGPLETCADTADDIVDELEDLIDDARG
jgi:hypothetical protein